MKVKVVKPGTLVWDAEQGVVVQDKPVQVRATGAIRDALNSKQIVEVFGDDEDSVTNPTIGPEVVKVEPKEEVVEPKAEVVEPIEQPKVEVVEPKAEVVEPKAEVVEPKAEVVEPIEQPKAEATKADKKLTVK